MALKNLSGRAERTISAKPDECYELLADVARWPDWYPALREVESQGDLIHVQANVFGMSLPFQAQVRLDPPTAVEVERVPYHPGDEEELSIRTSIAPDPGGSKVGAEFEARVDVPRLLPLPPATGDRLAGGLLSALEKRLAEPAGQEG